MLRRVRDLKRNKKHTNIVSKHGIKRKIVLETLDENSAFQLEKLLIATYHTFVYASDFVFGANFTSGGEGVSAPSHRRGKKLSQEHAKNISDGKRGKPTHWSRPKSDEFKTFISKALTGIVRSEKTRKKVSFSLRNNSNRSKAIYQIDGDEIVATHASLKLALIAIRRAAARPIRDCCNGKQEIAYGFNWRWKSPEKFKKDTTDDE